MFNINKPTFGSGAPTATPTGYGWYYDTDNDGDAYFSLKNGAGNFTWFNVGSAAFVAPPAPPTAVTSFTVTNSPEITGVFNFTWDNPPETVDGYRWTVDRIPSNNDDYDGNITTGPLTTTNINIASEGAGAHTIYFWPIGPGTVGTDPAPYVTEAVVIGSALPAVYTVNVVNSPNNSGFYDLNFTYDTSSAATLYFKTGSAPTGPGQADHTMSAGGGITTLSGYDSRSGGVGTNTIWFWAGNASGENWGAPVSTTRTLNYVTPSGNIWVQNPGQPNGSALYLQWTASGSISSCYVDGGAEQADTSPPNGYAWWITGGFGSTDFCLIAVDIFGSAVPVRCVTVTYNGSTWS